MSSVQEIYNSLFAGETIKVRCANKAAFHSLRTSLCRKNNLSVALEMTTLSVCATYDTEKCVGSFQLTESRRVKVANNWLVIEEQPDGTDT